MTQDANASGAPQNQGVALTPESGQPQPTGAATIDPNKIDLTQFPQFREYQSAQAKQQAAKDRELRELRESLAKVQQAQQAQQFANLDKLDPEERAEAYRKRVEQMEAERVANEQRQWVAQQIAQIVQNGGIRFDDPRLADVLGPEPSIQAMPAIAARVALLARQDADALRLAAQKAQEDTAIKAQQQTQLAAQQARNDALTSAGLAVTSSATPTVTPTVSEKDQKIAYVRKLRSAARGKGADSAEYRAYIDARHASGLSNDDLG